METVTLEFKGNNSSATDAMKEVGSGAEKMGQQVGDASEGFQKVGKSSEDLEGHADVAERRFTGFYDTIGGTKDALAALSDESLSTSDKLVALGQAGADLAGGFADFLIPAVAGFWRNITQSTIAQRAATAASIVWAAVTKGVTVAMQFLNAVIRANPIMFIVSLIAILVTAFLALWTRSAAFRNFFIGMWNGIKSVVGAVVNWIRDRWNDIVGFFRNLPSRIGAALGAIGGIFKGIFKGVVNIVIDAINWMIDRINDLIYGVNLVNPFDDIPAIPHIARLHIGGTVPGTPGQQTLALLQAGEHVSASGQGPGGGSSVVTFNGNVDSAFATAFMKLVKDGYITVEAA